MKANELRLGNLIKTNGVEKPVEWVTIANVYNNGVNIVSYEPIPLTEEWLVKFGFTKRRDTGMGACDQWQGLDMWFIDNRDAFCVRGNPTTGLSFPGWLNYPNQAIKYVHQLQNAFHALTGQELSINETAIERKHAFSIGSNTAETTTLSRDITIPQGAEVDIVDYFELYIGNGHKGARIAFRVGDDNAHLVMGERAWENFLNGHQLEQRKPRIREPKDE